MKTAISVPDKVYKEVEQHAKRTRKTRSRVYSEALSEYLLRHAPDSVTDSMNRTCDKVGDQSDTFVRRAARKVLRREKW